MRLTVSNLKGGAGKTTTAMYLAAGLARDGSRVVVIDADPGQGQGLSWAQTAGDDWPENITVRGLVTRNLARELKRDAADADHLVVDLGPKNPHMLREAVSVAPDLVIPTLGEPMTAMQVPVTIEAVATLDTDVYVHPLFVKVKRLNSRVYVAARGALERRGIEPLTAATRELDAYALAYGGAITDLGEYDQVLKEITANGG